MLYTLEIPCNAALPGRGLSWRQYFRSQWAKISNFEKNMVGSPKFRNILPQWLKSKVFFFFEQRIDPQDPYLGRCEKKQFQKCFNFSAFDVLLIDRMVI